MTRFLPLAALVVAGCSPSAPPAAVVVPEGAKVEVQADPVKPADEPPAPAGPKPVKVELPKVEPFRYAADAAGKKVEQALTPATPSEKLPRAAPRPRASDVERGELPTKKPVVVAPTLPPAARKPAMPSPPHEGVPATVGVGSEVPLAATKLPEGERVKAAARPEPTAADVPKMAVQQPDRIPVDDPTAELSTQRIVNTLMLAPELAAPFLRLILPDPFEFAEHLKAPPTPELATAPVFVPPARP